MIDAELLVEQRIFQLLQHFGIARAHIASRVPQDWKGFVTMYPESVASLTLVCPPVLDSQALQPLGTRLLAIVGDQGALAEHVRQPLMQLTEATIHTLHDYAAHLWSDVIADRCESIRIGMLGFLSQIDKGSRSTSVSLAEGESEHAGLFYCIRGAGPPLMLLPLALAPSQWEPLVPVLSQHYCTITLGGPFLDAVATLEERIRSSYGDLVQHLVEALHLRAGQSLMWDVAPERLPIG